jgi:hypothetical protein
LSQSVVIGSTQSRDAKPSLSIAFPVQRSPHDGIDAAHPAPPRVALAIRRFNLPRRLLWRALKEHAGWGLGFNNPAYAFLPSQILLPDGRLRYHGVLDEESKRIV